MTTLSEEICEVNNELQQIITKYQMTDITNENLEKHNDMKDIIKNEIRPYSLIITAAKELNEDIKTVEAFLAAIISNEKNVSHAPNIEENDRENICSEDSKPINLPLFDEYDEDLLTMEMQILESGNFNNLTYS